MFDVLIYAATNFLAFAFQTVYETFFTGKYTLGRLVARMNCTRESNEKSKRNETPLFAEITCTRLHTAFCFFAFP